MSRRILTMLTVVLATMSLVAVGAATAAPPRVAGTVGPGHTITLKLAGKKVTSLKAGVAYRFVVADRSDDHDFRLVGPGVNRVITGVEFMGTKSVLLKLKKGTYRFFCAPHADDMNGGFRVTG